jgi:CubicO group peptidase (beta-lactamase class C family)
LQLPIKVKKMMYTRFFWLYCALLFSCSAIFAQAPKSIDIKASEAFPSLAISGERSANRHELTTEDVGAFFDGFMPLQIGQANVAGAVIAVVKDGALVFAKGYGYADTEKKTQISPEMTLFRPGSISKLFIWTAVMQQVEQGKLDLDRDVNDYLDFKIPPAFDKPITLRDIMTHRTGFEETVKDLFVGSAEDLHPISQYLQSHMPSRIFPPGMTPAYSNYAATMAAYLVERVSGQNFNDYVEEHIFKPLDMNNSTFHQPLPDALKTSMSNGYILGSGDPKSFELVQVAPAGALSASAVDMTHFMIMHLQNGRYGNVQVLKPETAMQMHARQEGWPKAMNAMCLGFYEQSQNGYRIIGHEGNTILFHSNLFLILDANTGLFISYNSAGQSTLNLRGILFDKFMDRYFPEISSQEPEQPTAVQDVQSVIGTYELSRRCETTFLAVSTLFLETKVTANLKDNTISMAGINGLNQQPLHFREIAPMVFREVDGKAKIAFINDASGRRAAYIDSPFAEIYPNVVFQQVNDILDKQSVNYFVLGFSLSVIVLTLLTWPIAAMIRKHYAKPLVLAPNEKRLRTVTHLVCLSIVVYIVGLLVFASALSDFSMLSERSDLRLRMLQVVALIAGLGSLAVIYNSIRCWTDKQRWFWSKIWNTLLALACVGFFWFIYHWNLLNFHLKY